MELQTFKITLAILSNISNFTVGNEKNARQSNDPYQTVVAVVIVLVTGSVSFLTITGNILVMLSITINRNLQTINNYFLFSLACADLIIGINSMNLYTVYIVLGYWPLGPLFCDLWLVQDYVASYASSLNLLMISFDRYFCVTKPLSYPARRTTRVAGMMIATAWVVAFLVWAPVILFWELIVGERTMPEGECYLQFLYNATIICIMAIVLFYLPVGIMSLLYWQVSRASKSRVKKGKREPNQDNSSGSEAGNRITKPCDDGYVKTHLVQRSQNGGTGGVRENESSPQVHPERTEIAEAPTGYEGNATMAKQQSKRKAPSSREKKVTQTIMAILVAFVVTWTPYHVMLLINPFCATCVPSSVWKFGYWFLFVNSTVNPACYALCNSTFKKTFKQLLVCQHKNIRLGK